MKLFNKKALIIEEDLTAASRAGRILKRAGASVHLVADGAEGLRTFFQWRPDIVVLNIELPEVDGWTVCRKIHQMSNVPVVLLTDSLLEQEIMDALSCGTLDTITNPYRDDVLLTKVTAVLERTSRLEETLSTAVFNDGALFIDLISAVVIVNQEEVHLTQTEYRLLAYLVRHAGSVVQHEQILDYVWNWPDRKNTANVHVLISRLRQKIEPDPEKPRYLQLQYGVGYRFGY